MLQVLTVSLWIWLHFLIFHMDRKKGKLKESFKESLTNTGENGPKYAV